MKLYNFQPQFSGFGDRQRGTSLIWPLATVAISTVLIVSVHLPQQIEQQREHQSMADTNTSIQIVSALLSHYDDSRDINGIGQWPDPGDLDNDLAQYLPVGSANFNLSDIIRLDNQTGTVADLLINVQTNPRAEQLAAEFKYLNAQIVNEQGKDGGQDNTWVRLVLDTTVFGRRIFSDWANCSYEDGRETRTTISCQKDGEPTEWCLGSNMQVQYCQLPSRTDTSSFTYGQCNAPNFSWGEQTKTFGCQQGWDGNGNRTPCDNNMQQVACLVPFWAQGPASCRTLPVRCHDSYYWRRGWWRVETGWNWNTYEREMVFHCVSGRLDEKPASCQGTPPWYLERMECPRGVSPYTSAHRCRNRSIDYNGVPYESRGW